jgi:hypothetical protein
MLQLAAHERDYEHLQSENVKVYRFMHMYMNMNMIMIIIMYKVREHVLINGHLHPHVHDQVQ